MIKNMRRKESEGTRGQSRDEQQEERTTEKGGKEEQEEE